jgi:seryl-tRNA synthetase
MQQLCEHDFKSLAHVSAELAAIADPVERIRKLGHAYIRFAAKHPNHYRFMFMTPHAEVRGPEVLREASAAPEAALNPAVCYHVYAALAGTSIGQAKFVTAQAGCWRHEGTRHATLERGWAFTMREVVCIGSDDDARGFLERSTERVTDFARSLDLEPTVAVATDPFFKPGARAKQVLQQLKELKHELLLPIGPGTTIAASSFNLHETFFGAAFDIRLPSGKPAVTACVAFGLERWLLAFLVRYGPDAVGWPAIPPVNAPVEVRHD